MVDLTFLRNDNDPTEAIAPVVLGEQKTFSVYIEIVASGNNETIVTGTIEDILDDAFGAENYTTWQVKELTNDEVAEIETGMDYEDELAANEGV